MCDSRGESFVVPVRPSAGMGWWVGQIVSIGEKFIYIKILWIEDHDYPHEFVHSTEKYTKKFDDIQEAIHFLASKGVLATV